MNHHRFVSQALRGVLAALALLAAAARGQGVIADHTHTDLNVVPEAAILQAKQTLRIAYGHTSHGSQITDGMSGLVAFMNAKPADGFSDNLFTFTNGGTGGALDYRDFYGNFGGSGVSDLGAPNRTAWESATRSYLASHPEVNVIMWSWCGQVDGSEADIQTYLDLMDGLVADFPDVHFVYMTGHLNGGGATGNVHQRNEQIRAHCRAHNRFLFDFADIESFDPDGLVNYMELMANDNCDYVLSGQSRNWATAWQNAHTQNVDWYDCGSAHSQPLNANRKAYAAWYLFARIAGWAGPVADVTPPSVPTNLHADTVAYDRVVLGWNASTDAESGVSGYRVYRGGTVRGFVTGTTYTDSAVVAGETYSYTVRAINGATLASADSTAVQVEIPVPVDTEPPTVPGALQIDAVTTTSILIGWSASTDNIGVVGYRVYRDGEHVGTVVTTGYMAEGLSPSSSYVFTVSAIDGAGNESSLSSGVSGQTLDPGQELHTVRLEGTSDIVDAFLYASSPSTNYGGTSYVSTIDRFVIRFALPVAMQGRRVVQARVGFYVWAQSNYQSGQYLDLYRVTSPWTEASVTWNSASSGVPWGAAGGDAAELVGRIEHQSGSANWDHVYYPPLDITMLVQKWAAGTVPNHGLLMIHSPVTGIGLKASEYSPGPYLEITYTDEAAPNLYAMWQHGQFSDGQLADPGLEATVWGRGADPDGDGVPNLFEYALGSDPNAAGPALTGVLGSEGVADDVGTFVFRRQSGVTGVGFGLEQSADLATWSAVASDLIDEAVGDCGCGFEEVVWQVGLPSGASRQFYRLRLSAE